MEIGQEVSRSCDGLAPRTLDRVLLDEANHRVANEVASALAAMRLAQSAKGQRARHEMIDLAIDRLEGFGECSRMLAGLTAAQTDAGALIERMCRAMMRSRVGAGPQRVLLDLGPVMVDGETARRIAMIAHEILTNALKHAFRHSGGSLEVRLEMLLDSVVLSIIDDGPGLGPGPSSLTAGKRLGGRIVGDIVRASRGSMECDSGPNGTAVHVMLPKQMSA